MNQEKDFSMTPQELKKEIYRRMATAIYGMLATQNHEETPLVKSMYFVNDEKGLFYLFTRHTPELDFLSLNFSGVFSIFKEEEVMSEMAEIRAYGSLEFLDPESSEYAAGMALFEEKSPFIGNLPWISEPGAYRMLKLIPSRIVFQQMKEERAGKKPFILIR